MKRRNAIIVILVLVAAAPVLSLVYFSCSERCTYLRGTSNVITTPKEYQRGNVIDNLELWLEEMGFWESSRPLEPGESYEQPPNEFWYKGSYCDSRFFYVRARFETESGEFSGFEPYSYQFDLIFDFEGKRSVVEANENKLNEFKALLEEWWEKCPGKTKYEVTPVMEDTYNFEYLAEQLLSKDPVARADAVDELGVLGRNGNAKAKEAVIAALQDEEPVVRASAVSALRMIGDVGAVEPLKKALEAETNDEVKKAIDKALEWIDKLKDK